LARKGISLCAYTSIDGKVTQKMDRIIMIDIHDFLPYPAAKDSKSHDSRDAVYKVHLILVADAGQICAHILTLRSSTCLSSLRRRRVEAAVGASVVMPADWTQAV